MNNPEDSRSNNDVMHCQAKEIERYKKLCAELRLERDDLMCQVEKLKMELASAALSGLSPVDQTSSPPQNHFNVRVTCNSSMNGYAISSPGAKVYFHRKDTPSKNSYRSEADKTVIDLNLNNSFHQSVDEDADMMTCGIFFKTNTYSSSGMTRLSSSNSSSASSSPVLFGESHQDSAVQFSETNQEHVENGIVDNQYNIPARDAALVIQRAYRRYSLVKEFHRIKTERRLSKRINNNVSGTPNHNGCDICMELRDAHSHPHSGQNHSEVEYDIEDASIPSVDEMGQSAHPHNCADITDVEVVVDQNGILSQKLCSGSSMDSHKYSMDFPCSHAKSAEEQVENTLPPKHPVTCNGSTAVPPASSRNVQTHLIHHGNHSSTNNPAIYGGNSSGSNNHSIGNATSHGFSNVSSSLPQHHPHFHHHHYGQSYPHQHHLANPDGLHYHSSQAKTSSSKGSSPASTPQTNISPNLSMCSGSSASMGSCHLNSSSNIRNGVSRTCSGRSSKSQSGHQSHRSHPHGEHSNEQTEVMRKRLYRVGLNLFNKKPAIGIDYLVKKKFLEGTAPAVARFFISRKGLSKQMIGEYLANLQSPFAMACLEHFANEIELSSLPIDVALRRFQSCLRMPGEAQKIERIMESFSRRYAVCNPLVCNQFRNGADTIFVLAFAIIMLNTDLHTPHLKADKRMKMEDFIKNLRGIDDGMDIERDLLVGIYERIKASEFKTGSDHVTQVMKVQQTIVGKKPNLALPHRRLVCYCRLYEVPDLNKKEKSGSHQREVFLFNDLLVLTKIFHKKKNTVTYSFRQSYPLQGIQLNLFNNQYYDYGLNLKMGDATLLCLNARNEHDRAKFAEDLREAISESDEMARIESLSKESRDRDSGVDVGKMKRFSNSLLDIKEQSGKPTRRGSCGSLDSGMSVSFHSDEQAQGASHHNGNSHQTSSSPSTQASSANTLPKGNSGPAVQQANGH